MFAAALAVVVLALAGCGSGRAAARFVADLPLTPLAVAPPDIDPAPDADPPGMPSPAWVAEWVRSLDQPRRWTAAPGAETHPAVSPDGRLLAYVSADQGSDNIYLLPLPPSPPSPPRRLVDSPARDYAPRFSPDGKWIAYVSTLEDVFGDLWVASVRSGATRRLTDRATRDTDPVWMPDGRSLLFTASEQDAPPRLRAINARTGQPTPLDAVLAAYPGAARPDVAPDGRRVAFLDIETASVRILDLETNTLTRPTPGTVPEDHPRFTPDGRALLYRRAADDTNADDRHDAHDHWTVWRVDLEPTTDDDSPSRATARTYPLTTATYSVLQFAPFRGGFFFAAAARDDARGEVDLFAFGEAGAIPRPDVPPAVFEWLIEEVSARRPYAEDVRIAAWRQVSGNVGGDLAPETRHSAALEEVRLLAFLGRFAQADRQAKQLVADAPPESLHSGLAAIERVRIALSNVERASANPEVLEETRRASIETLRAVQREHPAQSRVRAEALMLEATLLSESGRLEAAINATDPILANPDQFPDLTARSLLLRGRMQEHLGLPEEVVRTYRRVLEAFPAERPETLEAARRIVDLATRHADDDEHGRRILNELIADPDTPPLLSATAQNRIGDLFAAEDRLGDALDIYRVVERRYPEQTEAVAASHFAQSKLYFDQGLLERSVEAFERIEERLRPRRDTFHTLAREGFIRQTLLKGEAEWRQRDPYLSRATFVELLDHDPNLMEAWRGILRADNAIGRIPETLREIETGLAHHPLDATLRYARGLALTYLPKRLRDARRELEIAALLDPSSPYPHQTLGYLLEQDSHRTGDSEAAERALREYQLAHALTNHELVPYNAAALLVNMGNAARLLGLWGLAQTYYSLRAADPQPHEDPRTEYLFWRRAGEAAFNAGDSAAAERAYTRALDILPEARELDLEGHDAPPTSGDEPGLAADAAAADADLAFDLAFDPAFDFAFELESDLESDATRPASTETGAAAAQGVSRSGVDWENQKTELIDRRALALQELGRYDEAAEGFATVAERTADPRARALAQRNVGVNLYLAARALREPERTDHLRDAWHALRSSFDSVREVGVISPRDRQGQRGGGGLFSFAAVVGLGGQSTAAGLGFDREGELRLLHGFLGWIAETDENLEQALAAIEAQLDSLPKPTDATMAYTMTQRAVLLSRAADLEERRGDLARAARFTLESLAACRYTANKIQTTNLHGTATAAMNLARLWLLDPEAVAAANPGRTWLLAPDDETTPEDAKPKRGLFRRTVKKDEAESLVPESELGAVVARLLENAAALLAATPPPPAAALLPDLTFHQGLVAFRWAERLRDAPAATPAATGTTPALPATATRSLDEAVAFLLAMSEARSFFGRVESLLSTPRDGALAGVPRSPDDRERWRRLRAAATLHKARALAHLGLERQAEQTAAAGIETARAWRYGDLLLAHGLGIGLDTNDPDARLAHWRQTVAWTEAMPPGERSVSPAARAVRATLGARLAETAARDSQWEEAWRWSEWAAAQDLAAAIDRLDPEPGAHESAWLVEEFRATRRAIHETLDRARRSDIALDARPPSNLETQLATHEANWADLLEAAQYDAPEVWSLVAGQPMNVGDIIDLLGEGTALVRLAWLETGALVAAVGDVGDPGLIAAFVEDPDGGLRRLLQKAAGDATLDARERRDLADRILPPVAEALERVESLEIAADAVFAAAPLEILPVADDDTPLFARWTLSWTPSTAHRYLAETRRAPWRERLLRIGVADDDETPFPWSGALAGSILGERFAVAGREADLLRTGWRLALDGRHPPATRLTPPGEVRAPGLTLSAGRLFAADWALSCLAIEGGTETAKTPAGRSGRGAFAALNVFLNGSAWGGAPCVALAPPRKPAASNYETSAVDDDDSYMTASRVWKTFWSRAAEEAPAQALQGALVEALGQGVAPERLAGFRVWGYPGMSREAAVAYAVEEFENRLGRAVAAHQRADWPAATRAFQEALFLLDLIDPYDPMALEIAEFLAMDADLAGQYELGARAARRLIELREAFEADAAQQAAAHRLHGVLLSKSGRHDESAEAMTRALELYREADDPERVLATTIESGILLENAERYTAALESFREAQAMCAEYELPEDEAAQWRRIGRVLLLRLEDWGEAADAFEEALALFEALGDDRHQAEALLDLGQVHERRADFDRALEAYAEAEAVALALDDRALLARVALNQANTHWFTANYRECLERIELAMALARATENDAILLAAHNTDGLLRWALNDYERAMAAFEKAMALSRAHGWASEEASTYNNIGLVWRSRELYPRALASFGAALDIDRRTGSRWGQAYDHRNIGMTYLLAGNLPQAREQLREAVRLSLILGARTNYVKAVLSLADTHRQLGLLDEAETGYDEALAESNRRGIREVEWRALRGRALVALDRGRRAEAIEWLDRAIELVEQMRASIRVEELQDGFLADKQSLYEDMILLLLDEGRVEDAFETSERARGRNFIDLLGNQRLDLNDTVDQALIDRDREIRGRVARIESSLGAAETDDERQTALRELEDARRELADLLVEIRRHNPALSAFVSVDPIALDELHELLGGEVALVEYFLAETELIAWVVADGRVRTSRVPLDRRAFVEKVTSYRRKIQAMEYVDDLSREIYDLVFRPVAPLLGTNRTLAIVPHNALHYLSFASLSDGAGYTVDRYGMFYLPSASVYRYTHARRRPDAGRRVLAIGNPDLRDDAMDLPFAAKEAERMVWAFPERVDILTGERATERWVRENITEYGVIHIASHGEFDSINPLFSALLLASDEEETDDDGRLTVRDIFALTINADLVALSACQTGLAQINNGDDLVGLNRAFVYAGTHALLSSLWRIDDVATAVLVKHFYRSYEDADKAEALRRAQVQVRRFNPHPAYWAGLVLTGDWK